MNIYISNLDLQLQDADLRELFTSYGDVQSATVSMDAFTNTSRGFGYVEMPDEEQAQAAIAGLHDSLHQGKTLTVHTAPPQEEKRGSYKVGNGGINPYRFKKN